MELYKIHKVFVAPYSQCICGCIIFCFETTTLSASNAKHWNMYIFVSSGILNRQYYRHLFWCYTTEMDLTVKISMLTFFVLKFKSTLFVAHHFSKNIWRLCKVNLGEVLQPKIQSCPLVKKDFVFLFLFVFWDSVITTFCTIINCCFANVMNVMHLNVYVVFLQTY